MGIIKFIKSIITNIVEIVIVIVVLAGAVAIGGFVIESVDSVRNFFFPHKVAVETSRTIVNSLQGMGQLVTVSSDVAKTDIRISINEGFLNSGYYSANHLAVGAIEAGINFDAISEDSVSVDEDTLAIILPAPEITSCRIEHIDQNQHSFTLLAADWDAVRQLAQYEAIVQFAQEMIEAGILDKAEDETSIRIGDFVRRLTNRRVQVTFEEHEGQPSLPSSCQPEAPSGWEKTAEGDWKRAN